MCTSMAIAAPARRRRHEAAGMAAGGHYDPEGTKLHFGPEGQGIWATCHSDGSDGRTRYRRGDRASDQGCSATQGQSTGHPCRRRQLQRPTQAFRRWRRSDRLWDHPVADRGRTEALAGMSRHSILAPDYAVHGPHRQPAQGAVGLEQEEPRPRAVCHRPFRGFVLVGSVARYGGQRIRQSLAMPTAYRQAAVNRDRTRNPDRLLRRICLSERWQPPRVRCFPIATAISAA